MEILDDSDPIVALIYGAAVDSRKWANVLAALQTRLGAKAVTWVEFDFASQSGRLRDSVGIPRDYKRLYAKRYVPLNPWLKPLEYYAPGRVSHGEEETASDELRETEFYRGWLKPQNLCNRVCATVRREDHRVYYLEAFWARQNVAFETPPWRLLEPLMPHLQRAIQHGKYLWQMTVALDILEYVPMGVVAVDEQGRALYVNSAGKQLLDQTKGLCLTAEGLVATAPNIAQQLKRQIADAAVSAGAEAFEGGPIMIRRGGSLPPLRVVVSPLGRQLREVVGQENEVALVFINAAEIVGKVPQTVLRTAYGLTPAEQRLGLLILEGNQLKQAANKLAISINTARSHMKRIYAKTGTDGQADLVRLLLAGQFEYPRTGPAAEAQSCPSMTFGHL